MFENFSSRCYLARKAKIYYLKFPSLSYSLLQLQLLNVASFKWFQMNSVYCLSLVSFFTLQDQELAILQRKTQADEVELMTLRKATQLQKDGLYNMELKLQHSLEDGSRMKYELDAATAEVIKDCDRKIVEREAELEKEQKAIKVKKDVLLPNLSEENLNDGL